MSYYQVPSAKPAAATASVTVRDFSEDETAVRVAELLAFYSAAGEPRVPIRGASSLSGSSEPLFVLDGVITRSIWGVAPEDSPRLPC